MKRLIHPSFMIPGFYFYRILTRSECLCSFVFFYLSLVYSDSSDKILVEEEQYIFELL
jgi:hypothetical protein